MVVFLFFLFVVGVTLVWVLFWNRVALAVLLPHPASVHHHTWPWLSLCIPPLRCSTIQLLFNHTVRFRYQWDISSKPLLTASHCLQGQHSTRGSATFQFHCPDHPSSLCFLPVAWTLCANNNTGVLAEQHSTEHTEGLRLTTVSSIWVFCSNSRKLSKPWEHCANFSAHSTTSQRTSSTLTTEWQELKNVGKWWLPARQGLQRVTAHLSSSVMKTLCFAAAHAAAKGWGDVDKQG